MAKSQKKAGRVRRAAAAVKTPRAVPLDKWMSIERSLHAMRQDAVASHGLLLARIDFLLNELKH